MTTSLKTIFDYNARVEEDKYRRLADLIERVLGE
jgi:hypothetical protein